MSQADDPYVYPGTSVLRNKLNMRDARRLGRAENDLTSLRYATLLADIDSYNADERLALDGDTRPYIARIRVAVARRRGCVIGTNGFQPGFRG